MKPEPKGNIEGGDILNYDSSIVLAGGSNIGVDSPYCSGSWGYIFRYTHSSTRSVSGKYTPSSTGTIFSSTLPVELDLFGKILPS